MIVKQVKIRKKLFCAQFTHQTWLNIPSVGTKHDTSTKKAKKKSYLRVSFSFSTTMKILCSIFFSSVAHVFAILFFFLIHIFFILDIFIIIPFHVVLLLLFLFFSMKRNEIHGLLAYRVRRRRHKNRRTSESNRINEANVVHFIVHSHD